MSDLLKSERITVRFSPEQIARIEKASEIEGRRRGEMVDAGTLLRELTMPRVDEIIAGAVLTQGG